MIAADEVVTFEDLDQQGVLRDLGEVSGEVVRTRNVLRTTFRTLGALLGLPAAEYLTEAERARPEALQALRTAAESLGANGIIGVRFVTDEQTEGTLRLRAFGRAVILAPRSSIRESAERGAHVSSDQAVGLAAENVPAGTSMRKQ